MKKSKNIIFSILAFSFVLLFISSCDNYTEEEQKYIQSLEKYRAEKDIEFRDSLYSPFNRKGKVKFQPLKYFKPNFDFIFTGKLVENKIKDTVKVYGTKGEERKSVRFGTLKLSNGKEKLDVKVYETLARDGISKYYSIWFTDKTTNNESYGVGRYLEFELKSDSNFLYRVDFNYAFNPYCAYSSDYSCAIPTKEDYLDIAVEAGEKKFHD
jgi:uncharacterized protein (DUF1684 family)